MAYRRGTHADAMIILLNPPACSPLPEIVVFSVKRTIRSGRSPPVSTFPGHIPDRFIDDLWAGRTAWIDKTGPFYEAF